MYIPIPVRRPVLLFDLFGVIAKKQPESSKRKLEALSGVGAPTFWNAYWRLREPYDRGISAAEYWRSVGEAVRREYDAPKIAALTAADVESWSHADEELIAYLRVLYDKYCLAALSNIPIDIVDFYERNHRWMSLFSTKGFSSRMKVAKPSLRAYHLCCEKLQCLSEDVYFIDDREANIAAAKSVGMKTHLYCGIEGLRDFLDGKRGPKQFRV
jgi:putative hydrolase of the HAD superfamily